MPASSNGKFVVRTAEETGLQKLRDFRVPGAVADRKLASMRLKFGGDMPYSSDSSIRSGGLSDYQRMNISTVF